MNNAAVISLSERTLVYRPSGPLDVTSVVDFSAARNHRWPIDDLRVVRVVCTGPSVAVRVRNCVSAASNSSRAFSPATTSAFAR